MSEFSICIDWLKSIAALTHPETLGSNHALAASTTLDALKELLEDREKLRAENAELREAVEGYKETIKKYAAGVARWAGEEDGIPEWLVETHLFTIGWIGEIQEVGEKS